MSIAQVKRFTPDEEYHRLGQVIKFPCFPDFSIDLAKMFPPKLNF
ncbi:MAG: hypothetical protein V7L01_04625 [Nostoc sp.]